MDGDPVMEVSTEEAFAEACRALGEAMVRERIYARRIAEQQDQIASLTRQVLHPEEPTA